MTVPCVTQTNLAGLQLRARGKVRDIYEVGDHLLIVASDRISAFDWVLSTPIPYKGRVLTQLSAFWFEKLAAVTPHHLVTTDVAEMPPEVRRHADILRGRAMLCRRAQPFGAECIVRGYLTGSGWKDYQKTGAVCGVRLPAGLEKNARIAPPIFTPSTKADVGVHDENIDFDGFRAVVGEHAETLRDRSLAAFQIASEHGAHMGVTICDTKLEWGLIDGRVTLIDEAFTPDSSRFWKSDELAMTRPGGDPPSFDKQVVRNWLERTDWDKASPPPALPPAIVDEATRRYLEIYERLTGRQLDLA
jgi:phosphoribosylaminoimidazole-succinocarboxamide synthase